MRLFAQMGGFDALSLKAKALIEAARFGLTAGASEAAMRFQMKAQEYAPVQSGELRDGIVVEHIVDEPEKQVYAVISTAPHAAFVEYGTGLRGEAAPHPPLPAEGVPITGSWIYDYRGQNWAGMAAQPSMRPAYDEGKDEAAATIRDSVRGEVQAAGQTAYGRRR